LSSNLELHVSVLQSNKAKRWQEVSPQQTSLSRRERSIDFMRESPPSRQRRRSREERSRSPQRLMSPRESRGGQESSKGKNYAGEKDKHTFSNTISRGQLLHPFHFSALFYLIVFWFHDNVVV